MTLHRYVTSVDYITGGGSTLEKLKNAIGKKFVEKGFTSTSVMPDATSHFIGGSKTGVHMEILTPNGVNGGFVQDYATHTNEYEFLLNRNTEYEVVDAFEREIKYKKHDYFLGKDRIAKKKEVVMKLKVVN